MDGSFGKGRYLRTVYHLSHCKDGGLSQFSRMVQQNYESLSTAKGNEALIEKIDTIIEQDSHLHRLCHQDLG